MEKSDNDHAQLIKANEELALEVQQRHKAEEALHYRLEFGRIINILSTHFINVPLDEIDDGISGALQTIAEFVGFNRGYVFLFSRKESKLAKTYEWWGENASSSEPRFSEISDKSLPCLMERLVKLETVIIPDIEDFTALTANPAQIKLVAPKDIKSFVAIPMVYGGFLMGFLGFDTSKQKIEIPEDIVSQLKITGEIFVNALVRKETEELINSEKERLAVTLRSIKDAVISTDTQGKITLINRAAEELIGWMHEEAVGRPFDDVVRLLDVKTHQLVSNSIHEALRGGRAVDVPRRVILLSKNGSEKIVVDRSATLRSKSSVIIGAVSVIRDVTAEQRMEDELFKKQKFESLGLLAGGIAHDFNNILTSTLSNISLMKMQDNLNQDMKEMLDETEKATLQATKLTQQLLTIAKGGTLVKKTASLSELLKDTAKFVLRGSKAKCELLIDENLWPVDIDVDQIAQVIQNMIINAEQAMPNGGILNIFANNVIVDEKMGLPIWSGKYIKISIRDQGIGMSGDQLKRLFEPYFTTKPKGNGLGLATAYSIIKRHEGYINVESQEGKGTTFQIYLPASQKLEVAKENPKGPAVKGKILIMDDEDLVRRAIQRALASVGYGVEVAPEGRQTLKLYQEAKDKGEPFDAVILDLTISGGMGGKEVMEQLVKIDPKVRGIASSGYSTDVVMTDFLNYGFKAAIVKPYNIEDISKVLDRVIAVK
jgi:PAS domain S-box-containing protein